VVLHNAEKYKVDIYDILELRKNLMNLYVNTVDHYNSNKMTDWLLSNSSKFDAFSISMFLRDKNKANYSEYLAMIGEHKFGVNIGRLDGEEYLIKASNIIKNVKGYPELKFIIYSQLAQTYVYNGDFIKTQENLKIADNIIKDNPQIKFDNLSDFIKTRMLLLQGMYGEALNSANKTIKNNLGAGDLSPDDVFVAVDYIMKSEILNYMGRFNDSYDILSKVYNNGKTDIAGENEVYVSLLTQLAWAELGKDKKHDALTHAEKALTVFKNNESIFSAIAYKVYGDTLSANNENIEKVINAYSTSNRIYEEIYGEDKKFSLHDVKALYFNAAKNVCSMVKHEEAIERIWYYQIREDIMKHWGNDPQTREIVELEKKTNCLIRPINNASR